MTTEDRARRKNILARNIATYARKRWPSLAERIADRVVHDELHAFDDAALSRGHRITVEFNGDTITARFRRSDPLYPRTAILAHWDKSENPHLHWPAGVNGYASVLHRTQILDIA